ncbi:Receptor-type guanylate cyclase gcy [Seminavis robusta]|uniref:Receptor-type guanylate cyclase gcy n=1 Tax=Seminavis robusta TaxID=568900 RepID=A0A9N8DJU6_9STRA|nr:Receptor-type guanylate cyclase gcy [Seminavis robusta]|eukprot:Sro181_g079010.1 Receptor-type guanylate cyclase gcy (1106) ;mRNA; f:23671-27342
MMKKDINSSLVDDDGDLFGDELSVTNTSDLEKSQHGKKRDFTRDKWIFTTTIVLLGAAVSGAFIALGVVSAQDSSQQSFRQRATEIVFQVEASWNVYVLFTKWTRESCHKPFEATGIQPGFRMGDDPSWALGYCSDAEFDKIFEYSTTEGLIFQSLQYVPNITDAERPYIEAYAEQYYETNYPGKVDFVGFKQRGASGLEPSETYDFYFPVVHLLPVETNAAAVLLDPYNTIPTSKVLYDKATSTWEPALGGRIRTVQETDPSAYSVIMYHPGVRTEHEPVYAKSPAVAQLIVRMPDMLVQFMQGMLQNEKLYVYDSTDPDTPVYLVAGTIVNPKATAAKDRLEKLPEVELADIPRPRGAQYEETVINANDRKWTVVIVSTNEKANLTFVILGGAIIFLACCMIAVWYYRHLTVLETMTSTQNLLTSVFPKDVQDRLLKDAAEAAGGNNDKEAFKGNRGAELSKAMKGITPLPKTKPIADLVLEASVLFADITGFTAWSSTREPFQVFTLLETVFHSFDVLAKRRRVFKVETVGDCYVACTGLPEPRRDHAAALVRFAKDCLNRFQVLSRRLEVELGPDTAQLGLRIGIHSGPVTSGVLRGDRPRFQLFGDTMNCAARIESLGQRNRIHISKETADLLAAAGKKHWIVPRKEKVYAKGKGELETFWCTSKTDDTRSVRSGASSRENDGVDVELREIDSPEEKLERLIEWNTSVFVKLLKGIVSRRRAAKTQPDSNSVLSAMEKHTMVPGETVFEETVEVLELPEFDAKAAAKEGDPEEVQLDDRVIQQLADYVQSIARLYRANPFHNYEHATHVIMSTVKLLSRIVAPQIATGVEESAAHLHDHTYGITSDPLTQFSVVLSALIHDADHPGVPNTTLVKEETPLAQRYKNVSIAEQNSVDIAWTMLMADEYADLRRVIYTTKGEFQRFRQLIVNCVCATDVMDKTIGAARKVRWNKAFSKDYEQQALQEPPWVATNRKATIVLEHLIQASDVAHTMQHWHIYRKWNQRLFHELYKCYKEGRLEKNPAEFWYEGEMGFLDYYVIPLADKLETCGVFGVSSGEFLSYATQNRQEWESKGKEIIQEMMQELEHNESVVVLGVEHIVEV